MKTARERAIKELTGVWLDADNADTEIHAGHADDLIGTIESAGLRIVDAELHQALIDAVRARQWATAWAETYPDHWWPTSDVASNVHARAVELLAERGE